MGIIQRIAIVLKSCFATAEDHLDKIASEEGIDTGKAAKDAAEELKTLDSPVDSTYHPLTIPPPPTPRPTAESTKLAADYKLLGLKPGVDLDAVEAAWRELAHRADPKRFPPQSPEEKRAAEILQSINEAYARIREELNPTEGRFGRLEL